MHSLLLRCTAMTKCVFSGKLSSHLTERLQENLVHVFSGVVNLGVGERRRVERKNLFLFRLQASTHFRQLQNPLSLHNITLHTRSTRGL